MGIHGLSKLIITKAQNSIVHKPPEYYSGKVIAIDASMQIYQCLIAVRYASGQLTDSTGSTTSHITGILYRTIRLIEHGIKPVYVFDGKAPELKQNELNKRKQRQAAAEEELKKLNLNSEETIQQEKRTVRATKKDCDDIKELLTLMGIPYIDAPSEAEATCAALVKCGKAYATATEDMDALTLGSTKMIRNINSSDQKKQTTTEYNLELVLKDLAITMDQFIDVCILCGCDYTKTIKGIGPVRALALIQEHNTIENVMSALETKHGTEQFKELVPEEYPIDEVRKLFKDPEVLSDVDITWLTPQKEELIEFLTKHSFSEDRLSKAVDRLISAKSKGHQHRN